MSWHGESIAEVVPEGDAELGAGLHETEEGITAAAAGVAVGSAADLSLGNEGADVALGTVGVQRDLGPVEHHQQFGFVGMQPPQQSFQLRARQARQVNRRRHTKLESNRPASGQEKSAPRPGFCPGYACLFHGIEFPKENFTSLLLV